MTNGELSVFYALWNQAAKTGMMKQDQVVTKAIEYHCNISKVPVLDCEMSMLKEIAERWNTSVTKK